MSDRVIIAPHAGGLGDQLMYSTLPERYVRERGAEVFISRHPASRNPELVDLIWKLNPFVNGMTDEPANAGVHLPGFVDAFIGAAQVHGHGIAAVEALHGFEPSGRWPKVYYQPKFRPDARTTVFADPHSISQPVPAPVFNQFAYEISRYRGYDLGAIVVLHSKFRGPHGGDALAGNPRYELTDIFEYCDLIWSSRAFLVTESGGHSLAAALVAGDAFPRVHVQICDHSFNHRIWTYANLYERRAYHATGRARGEDYLPYPDPPDGFGEIKRA